MRRFLIFFTGMMLFLQHGHGQPKSWFENFDGALPPSIDWVVAPTGAWKASTTYFRPSAAANPQSYRGVVPSQLGDSIVLETPFYDFRTYSNVFLRFWHICKVSPSDKVRIEYRLNTSGNWYVLPITTYEGAAANYGSTGFNAASYPQWNAADSTALPNNTWWREEQFDVSYQVGFEQAKFRFVIKRGNVVGTNISQGWFLEDFEVLAAPHLVNPPTVQLVSPYVIDTVQTTGPWDINVRIKSNTTAPVQHLCIYTIRQQPTELREIWILF